MNIVLHVRKILRKSDKVGTSCLSFLFTYYSSVVRSTPQHTTLNELPMTNTLHICKRIGRYRKLYVITSKVLKSLF